MSKETRPAFMLYASDWLAGTADLTMEEKGLFMDMLCQQWLRGSLPNDLDKLCRMFGGHANRIAIASILHKFCICEDGTLHNAKLERVRESSRAAAEKRSAVNSENAKKRWDKRPLNDNQGQLSLQDEEKQEDAIRNAIALRSESESISRNEYEIEDETRGVQGGNLPVPKFDAVAAAKTFQFFYRLKQGKPIPLERAFSQVLTEGFQRLKIPYDETAKRINVAAKEFMEYHSGLGTEIRHIPNPETWLNDGSWQVDWKAALETAKSQETQSKNSNGNSTGSKSAAKEYTDAAIAHAKQSEL
jgi:uncharacterized protein YdaU (DUF1376 family)